MMPATRAIPNTSPFLWPPCMMSSRVVGAMKIRPSATASCWVMFLAPTSTICASPLALKCVRLPLMIHSSSLRGVYHRRRGCNYRGIGAPDIRHPQDSAADLRHAHAADVGDVDAQHRRAFLGLEAILRLLREGRTEYAGNLVIVAAGAQHALHVILFIGIEAITDATIRGQADARTVAAQAAREGGDHGDFTGITGRLEDVVFGTRAGRIHDAGVQSPHLVYHDFGASKMLARFPDLMGIEGHELEEHHGHSHVFGELTEGRQFVFVETAHQHDVHLDYRVFKKKKKPKKKKNKQKTLLTGKTQKKNKKQAN